MQDLMERKRQAQGIFGVVIGILVGFTADGQPLVAYGENPKEVPVIAQTTVPLENDLIGKKMALLFTGGDPRQPIIIGPLLSNNQIAEHEKTSESELVIDGKHLLLTAENELTLTCGEASITLKKNGKILLTGTNLLSRAKFANRIKGGSVQIN